jgi:uncharacterized protein YcnI
VTAKTLIARAAMAAGALALASPAFGHVVLTAKEAKIAAPFTANFKVEHGCDGSPTVRLRIQIPEGVIAVRAQKPGWTVSTVTGKYSGTYVHNGAPVSEGIREVAFTGNLPDKTEETFPIELFLTDVLKPNTTVYFPVVQECQVGVTRWIEIPAAGKTAKDYERPAAALNLLPK